ncbi:PaaI family thioesterase [Desulfobotulus sp. H1]|uniref:Acyl-coenzyme A thioesterase THEM4 n=1 Tax=Desulfobotulus pelophilus TaxID=2823377 RepID=A0ABT3N900_9BACT|nr:PaaI family thioesterase [Desulfobotulus pelophilus]MCW7753915.1 PaaI family thioesterase [Desulfobotulus pelophilus]
MYQSPQETIHDFHLIDPSSPLKSRCFGCSQQNPYGLRMQFQSNGRETLIADITVPSHLCGWNNLAHGGIIAAILDETMGTTGLSLLQAFIMTKTMTVHFKKPVPVAAPLRAQGKITRRDEKYAYIEACILDENNQNLASSDGIFRIFTRKECANLPAMDQIQTPAFFQHPTAEGDC